MKCPSCERELAHRKEYDACDCGLDIESIFGRETLPVAALDPEEAALLDMEVLRVIEAGEGRLGPIVAHLLLVGGDLAREVFNTDERRDDSKNKVGYSLQRLRKLGKILYVGGRWQRVVDEPRPHRCWRCEGVMITEHTEVDLHAGCERRLYTLRCLECEKIMKLYHYLDSSTMLHPGVPGALA